MGGSLDGGIDAFSRTLLDWGLSNDSDIEMGTRGKIEVLTERPGAWGLAEYRVAVKNAEPRP